MRWLPRYFTLPITGLSLTCVSIALIYVLYKKGKEDAKSQRSNIEVSRRITIECKVPRQHVPAVIGRGGSTIKDVQNKTGTQIHFKEDNIECPDRVCLIKGSHEATQLAERMIKSIIENQPIIETYEIYVPHNACRRIIGKGGEVIHQIQSTSSAKITVESGQGFYDTNAERRIMIKGTSEQIAVAVALIEEKVQEKKEAHIKLEASSAARLPRRKLSPRNTSVSTSEQLQTPKVVSVQDCDTAIEVYVSAAENPNQFWVHLVGPGNTALDKLVSEMTEYYSDEQNQEIHALKNVTLGQIVAAKFSFDEQWYRAEVTSTPEDGQCEVCFLDYGDREVVQLDSILELRMDFLGVPIQTMEFSLANIKPRENEWSSEACKKFEELTWLAQWKVLIAKIRGYKERTRSYNISRRAGIPIPCVDLFDKIDDTYINIGQELINEGFAEPEEAGLWEAYSKLSLSNRSHDVSSISTSASTSPLTRRAQSPETPTNILRKLESESPHSPITDPETPVSTMQRNMEVIDLVTPQNLEFSGRTSAVRLYRVSTFNPSTNLANELLIHFLKTINL
ncbi:tudor and KH domain containing protein papi isoform X2 [Megachile rotundata]|uniref:tudor and KH domain containing protein papi isoform X2 n=1 Tax=Megachile rotundata TaxID=143995 RepID=UPI000615010F|nr:PREDICTED: tudor and KH domain-containing protein isoform X2 [Megachile rotundata]